MLASGTPGKVGCILFAKGHPEGLHMEMVDSVLQSHH